MVGLLWTNVLCRVLASKVHQNDYLCEYFLTLLPSEAPFNIQAMIYMKSSNIFIFQPRLHDFLVVEKDSHLVRFVSQSNDE